MVFFPCPQISGSQVWLHIYLMSLTLSPRNSDWMVLRAARVLLCSPSCGQLRPLRVWDQLDVIYLFKRTDQINLVISALDSTFPNAMHSFLRALQGRQDRIFISILQVKTLKIQEKCQYSDAHRVRGRPGLQTKSLRPGQFSYSIAASSRLQIQDQQPWCWQPYFFQEPKEKAKESL